MIRTKSSILLAGIVVLLSSACASPSSSEEEATAPIDGLASDGTSEMQPTAVVQYADCESRGDGFMYWYYGTRKFGKAPPTAQQCTTWCTTTCNRSVGELTLNAYNPGRPPTATCYCY